MAIESAPIELIILQGTPFCNLDCTYCDLSVESRRSKSVMSSEILDAVFSQLFIGTRLAKNVTVIWHSGEPLTLPIQYYDDAIAQILELRKIHQREDIEIVFDMQSNGVLIDNKWCDFFERHSKRLNLGISCDGPEDTHDVFRLHRSGKPTFAKVERAMNMLRDRKIKYRIISVVTRHTLANSDAFYHYFNERREEFTGFHFNVVASSTSLMPTLRYSKADRHKYYDFYQSLIALSSDSMERDGESLAINNLTEAFDRIMAEPPADALSLMQQSSAPLRALNVEADGKITTFYAGLASDALARSYDDEDSLCLGSVMDTTLEEMFCSQKLEKIASEFSTSTQACRENCGYFSVCPGGFELTKKTMFDRFDATETPECIIHVQALTDAILDDVNEHLDAHAVT